MRFRRRRTWRNHTGNQTMEPLRVYEPRSLEDLVEIVETAERDRVTVRAIGSGHSWSDVGLTTGLAVMPRGLARALEVEVDLLREGVAADDLARVEGGMRIRELNALLDRRGKSLANMGGYDGQTIAGAISTSTHGSGGALGPLCDQARSFDVVGCRAELLRIEPSDGPTDPAKFAARRPNWRLVQDDRWFRAARVGMGCLGIIYAVTLEVVPTYWLEEVRTLATWEEVAPQIARGEVLADNRHFEVYFSPYARRDGRHTCLVTTRNPTEEGTDRRRTRRWYVEAAARFPLTPHLLNAAIDLRPRITPFLLERSLRALENPSYKNVSFNVLNIGAANFLPAYSSEVGVPTSAADDAVARIIDIAERHRRLGAAYHTSPIALRFVKESDASLSMMQGRDTMMIELIQMTRTEGGFELLAAYEDALYAIGGRPHWGQINTLTGSADQIRALYPATIDEWLEVHAELDATGVFASPFSKRVGITPHGT